MFRRYEEQKARQRRIDFEDVLELTIRLFEQRLDALAVFRERYRAFTVDEYQDVNLLQQTLLDLWLGERDDLCVVGDDYQAIYSFTGATPRYLLDVPRRFPHATVVRLEENHRSSPQVLGLANRLVPQLGGSEKRLRAMRGDGPEPVVSLAADREAEAAAVLARVQSLQAEGVRYEEMAVLVRINARSEDFEEAFAAGGVPFQVRGGAFLGRPAARRGDRGAARSAGRSGGRRRAGDRARPGLGRGGSRGHRRRRGDAGRPTSRASSGSRRSSPAPQPTSCATSRRGSARRARAAA